MAKFAELHTHPGAKDFAAMLRFLDDQDAYRERFEKLQELEEKINSQIETITMGQEIETARNNAEKDRAQARKSLDNAKARADEIMSSVEAQRQEVADMKSSLLKDRAELDKSEKELRKQQADAEKDLSTRASELDALIASAKLEFESAAATRSEYEAKLSKIHALAEEVS